MSDSNLWTEIQQFYAFEMRLLDTDDIDAWADLLTEDVMFRLTNHPEPYQGRAAVVAAMRGAARAVNATMPRRRRWLTGLTVIADGPDAVRTSSSGMLLAVEPDGAGGTARLLAGSVCDDDLIRTGMGWRIQQRTMRRDG